MSRITAVIVCPVLFAVVFAPAALADKITFKDGGKLEGKVIAENETSLTVETLMGGKPVKITVMRERIEKYEKSLTQAEEYAALVKKTGTKDADALVGLAQWCLDRKMKAEAIEHLKQTLLADPKHAGAEAKLKSLGFVKVGEMWMSEEEYKEYQGQSAAGGGGDAAAPKAEPKSEEAKAAERRAATAEAERKKQLEGVRFNLEKAETKLGVTERNLAEANRNIAAATAQCAPLEKQMAVLTEELKRLKELENSTDTTSWRRKWNSLNDQYGKLEVQKKTQEGIIRENKSACDRFEAMQKSQSADVKRLRDRQAELEKEAAEASAGPAPAPAGPPPAPVPPPVAPTVAPVPAPAVPAPVSATPAPVPAAPAPVPAAVSPIVPAPAAAPAVPAGSYPIQNDAKVMSEFVPWLKNQVQFKNSGHKDVDKYLEGQLHRWAVMSREVGQKAGDYPAIVYDSSRRLVVLEASVAFTNKAGGQIDSIYLEDGSKRRFNPPDCVNRDYWGRIYQYSYSEADRYFVESLCGSTLRKYLPYVPLPSNVSPAPSAPVHAMIRQKEGVRGGVGIFVPEGTRGLCLVITALMQVEESVIGGPGGIRVKQTHESLRLKVGDVPAGP